MCFGSGAGAREWSGGKAIACRIRRESYSSRFAAALAGIYLDNPATQGDRKLKLVKPAYSPIVGGPSVPTFEYV
jgi:hypothetical protein